MFTKVEVRNSQGSLLTLQLGDSPSGINIQEIAGLDPVKAVLVATSFANQDGAVYQASRRDARNITFKLGLEPNPATDTSRSLRQLVYSFFRPKSEINLKFFVDDTDDATEDGYLIIGRVESCNSPMFAQTPVIDISVMCFDPDFYDPIPVTVVGLTTADVTATHFPYIGTTESGITLTLNVNRTLAEFVLYYTDPALAIWTMDVVASLIAGDVVTINTIPGNKFASLLRAGVTTSILYAVSPQSTWPELAPGDNWFRLSATGAAIPGSITYTKRFGEL